MSLLLSIILAICVSAAIAGFIILGRSFRSESGTSISSMGGDQGDWEDSDDQGGGLDFDPDAPLDLPPGVYVLPKEPAGVPV